MFRRTRNNIVLGLCLSPLVLSLPTTQDTTAINSATAFAITYGYPVIQYATALDSLLTSVGTNVFVNQKYTARPEDTEVVRPNVDTLYSRLAIDLSQNDVVLTVPKVEGDRYYVFPFYDFWGNNFANLGRIESKTPGDYLLRFVNGSTECNFELAEEGSSYAGFINFPTTYGLSIGRIELYNNSTDLEKVYEIQDQVKTKEVPRNGHNDGTAPELTRKLLGDGVLLPLVTQPPNALNQSSAENLLELVAKLAPYNPPQNSSEISRVNKLLQAAGLSGGVYTPPADVDYKAANEIIQKNLLKTQLTLEPFGNDWVTYPTEYVGNPQDQYTLRSLITYSFYLALVQSETLYPVYDGDLHLNSDESYIVTFPSGKPEVTGFWSLTAYTSAGNLVSNPLKRYALGDRSNLTYPGGELVYGGGTSHDDKPFSILLQPADVTPPSNWTSNWLPTPAGGGNFTMNLRIYGPEGAMFPDGDYVYPVVTKGSAIREKK